MQWLWYLVDWYSKCWLDTNILHMQAKKNRICRKMWKLRTPNILLRGRKSLSPFLWRMPTPKIFEGVTSILYCYARSRFEQTGLVLSWNTDSVAGWRVKTTRTSPEKIVDCCSESNSTDQIRKSTKLDGDEITFCGTKNTTSCHCRNDVWLWIGITFFFRVFELLCNLNSILVRGSSSRGLQWSNN